jgi:hypothetical protein
MLPLLYVNDEAQESAGQRPARTAEAAQRAVGRMTRIRVLVQAALIA